jgi:hypothetical protein
MTKKEIGNKVVQLAFHQWQFEQNITGLHVVNNTLAMITDEGTLALLPLEIPGTIDKFTYLDKFSTGIFKPYTSGIWFSNFYFRDARGLGSNRGRMQLRTILYDADGKYMTTIATQIPTTTDIQDYSCFYPVWDDTLTWIDDNRWVDTLPTYNRRYYNDKLITVMADNEAVKIVFSNSDEYLDRDKGFELHTVNVESLYHQRSTRT